MKAFISYCHQDENILEDLKKHLSVLKREGLIEAWFDHEILPGDSIDQKIEDQLKNSELFLLIITPDFISSSYCMDTEMREALNRHNKDEARVIPIIAEPCDWKSIAELSRLKALPKDAKPISTWANKNLAFLNVVEGLRNIIPNQTDTKNVTSTFENKSLDISKKYQIRKDFDQIDKVEFKKQSFNVIKEFFKDSIEEIDSIDGLHGAFDEIDSLSFGCTLVNKKMANKTAYITVRSAKNSISFGDIQFSFTEHAPEGSMNGWFQVSSDDYNQFLLRGGGSLSNKPLTSQEAAENLWNDFITHVGIKMP
ncbi:TIR protein [Zymomonas mobilis subsp. mobilis NCIMB 11163]|uniref:toll/interleukin-1 receptor domain-containing protein n=1 Tax=Zymomonas mobilis TaxID=542 RepID=UPI0001B707B4|nr:toll/interleukin-1 receptor domain-containing protein [Zymomonas mobilis]ACV76158.1 TIR protein [Zymomonas mobilis subsp. mobilis NCIMB 11163]